MHTPGIPELRRLRPGAHRFKANLSYRVSSKAAWDMGYTVKAKQTVRNISFCMYVQANEKGLIRNAYC